jgi:hypothetical protein
MKEGSGGACYYWQSLGILDVTLWTVTAGLAVID